MNKRKNPGWCQNCDTPMNRVIRCDTDGSVKKLWRCPRCYYETKPKPYSFTDDAQEKPAKRKRDKKRDKRKNNGKGSQSNNRETVEKNKRKE